MAEQSKDILSEYTKDITPEQRAELQEKVSNMTEEELKELPVSFGKLMKGMSGHRWNSLRRWRKRIHTSSHRCRQESLL